MKNKLLQIRCTENEIESIKAKAKKNNLTVSEYCRKAIANNNQKDELQIEYVNYELIELQNKISVLKINKAILEDLEASVSKIRIMLRGI